MTGYRDAIPADGAALCAMARAAFVETFGANYAAADLAAFLDVTFGPSGLAADLAKPAYRIRLATDGGGIVGFAKIGPVAFPGEWRADAMELYQLYVASSQHGTGVGPALMDWAIAAARAAGASQMLLSVFVDNHRAKAFYARRGFVDIGRYDFRVGDHVDEDRIMRLAL